MPSIFSEEWFYVVGISLFFLWGIAVFLFGRITVKYIENEMAKEGILPPDWDKGIGARYPAYAGIIILPNLKRHASVVNIEATKRYARKKDFYLALFVQSSFAVCMIVMSIGYFLYAPDS